MKSHLLRMRPSRLGRILLRHMLHGELRSLPTPHLVKTRLASEPAQLPSARPNVDSPRLV
jgi:hypothetical protein